MQIKYVENNFSLSYAHLDWGFTKIKGFKRIYKLYILKTVIDTFFKFLIFSPCINEKMNLGGGGCTGSNPSLRGCTKFKNHCKQLCFTPPGSDTGLQKSEGGGGEGVWGDISGMRGPLSSPAVYLSETRGRCKEMAFFKLLLLGVNEIH